MNHIPEPKVEFIRGSLRTRLTEDWVCCMTGRRPIVVPAAFETDFASVPRMLWPIASPFGILRYGALPHDFGYKHRYLLTIDFGDFVPGYRAEVIMNDPGYKYGDFIPIHIDESRKYYDKVLRDIAISATKAEKRVWGAYLSVRICGYFAWSRYRRTDNIK